MWPVQTVTEIGGLISDTPKSSVENFRYRMDTGRGRQPLVANLSLYKDPVALSFLGFPLISNYTHNEGRFKLVFVTASCSRFFHSAMDAIARVQSLFPNSTIYFYDLSDGGLDGRVDKVSFTSMCRQGLNE